MMHLGIDLGTTYSLVAQVNPHGQPALFPDALNASQFRTPSVVYIGAEGTLVGMAAEELLDDAPELPVARFVKTHLADAAWRHPDHLGRGWSAEALSALVLRKLLKDADAFAGEDIGTVVLTVPAQFTEEQRRATLRAAAMAGLERVTLVEEPVAAASFYGLDEGPRDRTLLVYDFGGGTFDVTVLQTAAEGLFVLATDGIADLGGRIIDQRLVEALQRDFQSNYSRLRLNDAGNVQRLRRLAEDSKIKFAKPGLNQVRQALLLAGQPFEALITRAQFDAVAGPAVEQTLAVCTRCLRSASLSWADVDKIVLTGGSSLLPQVVPTLAEASGKTARDIVAKQPHQAVAFGAALLASRLAADPQGDSAIAPAATADLCLRTWDARHQRPDLETLIARNTPLPARYARTFYTNRDDQTRLVLEFVQRRHDPDEEHSLGHFAFGPIRRPRRNMPIEVAVILGRDGLLHATARDAESGDEIAHTLSGDAAGKAAPSLEQRHLVESVQINV